jgi:hypothetical protein
MFFRRVDASEAPAHFGAPSRLAKVIASAHRFAYDNVPALKDPYERAIFQFF